MLSITSLRADNISIGELSKQSGVNIETIRYYEWIKMLPAPPRTASGLEEIRALLALGGPERASCADVHKIASTHLATVRYKLSGLVKLEAILAETVAQCADGATPDCPVLDILDAGRQS